MMRPLGLSLFTLMVLMVSTFGFDTPAYGHALQPGYLEVRQIDQRLYAVVWKKPAVSGRPMAISAQLPEQCKPRTAEQSTWDGSAYLARWTATCMDGLAGGEIRIEGLEQTSTDVLVRLELADGGAEVRRLTSAEPSFTVPAQPGSLEVVRTYFLYGVEHILLGIDHLLFVLALLLLVTGVGRIVATVTAFTLAHSLTLAGATLGLIHVPGPPIEAIIALSIAFVAREIIHGRHSGPGLTERYPWIVAFIFGLLHGFGFASALAEVGLPQTSIPMALLFFNVGVEIGQLIFIASVVVVAWLARQMSRRLKSRQTAWSWAILPYAIGSLAIFWVIQRITAF